MKNARLYALLLMVIIIGFSNAQSQDLSKLMIDKAPNCSDIEYNSKRLLVQYHAENKMDSFGLILDYWQQKCNPIDDDFITIKTLYSMEKGMLLLLPNDVYFLNSLTNIQERREYKERDAEPFTGSYYRYYYRHYPQSNDPVYIAFDSLVTAMATQLEGKYASNRAENLLAQFYSGKITSIFDSIDNPQIINWVGLKTTYSAALKHHLALPEFNLALIAGLWIPTGNASLLGLHPLIGGQMGIKKNRITYNLTAAFRFLPSEEYYITSYKGTLKNTNNYFGVYFGGDVNYDLVYLGNHPVYISSGIAFDGFDAVESDNNNNNNNNGKTIKSFNFNVGLGYRFMFKNRGYLALQTNYHFVNYRNTGGTDLSGNTITAGIIWGSFSNMVKHRELKNLRYNKPY